MLLADGFAHMQDYPCHKNLRSVLPSRTFLQVSHLQTLVLQGSQPRTNPTSAVWLWVSACVKHLDTILIVKKCYLNQIKLN